MKQKYQSKILEAVHEEAQALFAADVIDAERITEYDRACIVSKPRKTPVSASAAASGPRPVVPAYARASNKRTQGL